MTDCWKCKKKVLKDRKQELKDNNCILGSILRGDATIDNQEAILINKWIKIIDAILQQDKEKSCNELNNYKTYINEILKENERDCDGEYKMDIVKRRTLKDEKHIRDFTESHNESFVEYETDIEKWCN